MAIQANPLALDALVGLASLIIQDKQQEQAVRLLQLAYHHSASSQETREKAAQKLVEIDVEPEALPHLSETLEEVVADVLRPYA
jgi:hypothetical protein